MNFDSDDIFFPIKTRPLANFNTNDFENRACRKCQITRGILHKTSTSKNSPLFVACWRILKNLELPAKLNEIADAWRHEIRHFALLKMTSYIHLLVFTRLFFLIFLCSLVLCALLFCALLFCALLVCALSLICTRWPMELPIEIRGRTCIVRLAALPSTYKSDIRDFLASRRCRVQALDVRFDDDE